MLLPAALAPILALIAFTPDPIAIHLGPIPVYFYGICYAIGIAASYTVIVREARRRGLDARLVDNGIIIVAAAALAGGRAYHVIDQWHLYADNPLKIILPPYTGLGVYGGILTGTLAALYIIRRWKQPFWKWADVIAPGLFVMQAIGRWGNFFNQELYGPPTSLPWGIAIDCAHRVGDHGIAQWACTDYPVATTGFQPLFLYESLSGVLGAFTLLWLARRFGPRMRPGDLLLIFFMWYAATRFWLETFREGNWTFFGIPTAMLVSALLFLGSGIVLALRHRMSGGDTWGEPPEPEDRNLYDDEDDEDLYEDEDEADEDEADDEDLEDQADDAADDDDEADEADRADPGPADDADDGSADGEARPHATDGPVGDGPVQPAG
jgi:phosphatidylglycerol:prolipoprotein diacylglycerol transferase